MHVHIIDFYFLIFQGRNDLMAIGLNSFEVLHLGTYFPELLANYVKVANTLEADTNFTKHLQKEAADPQESDDASTRLTLLANQQQVWVILIFLVLIYKLLASAHTCESLGATAHKGPNLPKRFTNILLGSMLLILN